MGWSGGEVGLGVGIEHRHLNQTPRPLSVALPKDGCPLIHTVGGLEGEEGFLANTKYRETTVPPLHTLPHEKIKKRG